jgi:hypothetical protein
MASNSVVGRFLPRDFFWDVGGFFAGIDGSVLCKYDVISINRYYAFSETTLGKSGPCGAVVNAKIGAANA